LPRILRHVCGLPFTQTTSCGPSIMAYSPNVREEKFSEVRYPLALGMV
jgi:hypothetical protein